MDIKIEKKHWFIRHKYPLIVGGIVIGVLAYFLIAGMGPSRMRYAKDSIIIAEVRADKFIDYLDVEGIAQAKHTIKLNSIENGTVYQIVGEEGSMLVQGDIILILNNLELERTIGDERDELAKKEVEYREKALQMERKTSELKRSTLKTVYELDRLSKQYELDKEEFEIGIKSKAQLTVAQDEFRFNQKNTKLLLDELKHDSLSSIIQSDLMKSDLVREQKKFGRNNDRLSNLTMRAPISGQLSYLSPIRGERVVAGSNIGEMKVIDELKIITLVSEYYIDRISVGLPAYITYQDEKYELKISKVNPEIKERNFEVDLVFTDKLPDNIRIGKNYRVQIEMGQPEDALVIDKGSFYQSTGGQWVFKLNESEDKAIRQPVVIGRQNPRQYEILEGLQTGDKVIISGYDYFGDAQQIILN